MIFEGYYQNGNINGKAREYFFDIDRKVCIFNGEYLNGKKWNSKLCQIFKLYNHTSKIITKSEYINGKEIRYKYKDEKLIYKSEFFNNKSHGQGKEYYNVGNKISYEGEFRNDKKWEGKGFNINGDIEYIIKNGSGKVKEYIEKGQLILEGEYLKGEKNGKIKEYSKKGQLILEGEYLYGKKNGYAKEFDNKGNCIFEGHYLIDIKNGMVKEKYISISYSWRLCEINEGEYINGKQNGKIKIYYYDFHQNKLIFEGEYLNGEKNGYAKEYNYNSIIIVVMKENIRKVKKLEYGKSIKMVN